MVPFHADGHSVLVHEERLAIDEVGVGMLGEGGGDEGKFAGKIPLVRVEPGDDVARRAAEALVDGVGLAVVGLGYVLERVAGFLRRGGAADEGIPALQDLDGVVRRPAVDDDVLDTKTPRVALRATRIVFMLARRARA